MVLVHIFRTFVRPSSTVMQWNGTLRCGTPDFDLVLLLLALSDCSLGAQCVQHPCSFRLPSKTTALVGHLTDIFRYLHCSLLYAACTACPSLHIFLHAALCNQLEASHSSAKKECCNQEL